MRDNATPLMYNCKYEGCSRRVGPYYSVGHARGALNDHYVAAHGENPRERTDDLDAKYHRYRLGFRDEE